MNLGRLWDLILFILNKEESGGIITPERRNILLSVGSQRYYSLMYEEFEKNQKVNDSLSVFDKISTLTIDGSTGISPLPTGYYHCTGLSAAQSDTLEIVTDSEFSSRQKNSLTSPTLKNSIALFISGQIMFQPVNLGTALMTYLSYPGEPYYDYYIDENDQEQFLPESHSSSSITKIGDLTSELGTISITGLTEDNTDSMRLFWTFGWNDNYGYVINFYKDRGLTLLVAHSNYQPDVTLGYSNPLPILTWNISEDNNSRLSGTIQLSPYNHLQWADQSQLVNLELNNIPSSYTTVYLSFHTVYITNTYHLDICSDPLRTKIIYSYPIVTSGSSFSDYITSTDGNSTGYLNINSLSDFTEDIIVYNGNIAKNNMFIFIPISQTVEYQWRYEDQLKIAGIILDMCGIFLNSDKIIQYAQMFGRIEK